MREIKTTDITNAIADLCVKANIIISPDIENALKRGAESEQDSLSKDVLEKLIENAEIARKDSIPICQDTGMAVVFAEIGQKASIVGGSFEAAINEGVRKGYADGYLRKSVVKDPIDRTNTKDNTPAVIYTKIVDGDGLKLTVAPKGFGSENMSRLAMLKPSEGIEGVKRFIIETVKIAGPNSCPPVIVGAGVGGTMDKCAIIAKEALLRGVGSENENPYWNGVEKELLQQINGLKIGPAGFGGMLTAMAVHINVYATHIAGLPVAVNIGCHVTRHKTATL